MATLGLVNPRSVHCRFCRGPIMPRDGGMACNNNPPEICEMMGRKLRNYCELCGEPDPAEEEDDVECRYCGQLGLGR